MAKRTAPSLPGFETAEVKTKAVVYPFATAREMRLLTDREASWILRAFDAIAKVSPKRTLYLARMELGARQEFAGPLLDRFAKGDSGRSGGRAATAASTVGPDVMEARILFSQELRRIIESELSREEILAVYPNFYEVVLPATRRA